MMQRGAGHHAVRQRGCLKFLEKTWYHTHLHKIVGEEELAITRYDNGDT